MKHLSKYEITDKVLCAEYKAVYRYTLSLCQNETEAQDITQETFLKALNARHNFQGSSSLYTWLCTIAKNIWLNKCKKSNKELIIGEIPEMVSESNIQKGLENKETAIEIHRTLHLLKEPYKEVFTLRVFGELSFADIGSIFAKTESWARVTYHRSKKTIMEQLRRDEMI